MPGSVYILNSENNFEKSFAGDYILVWGDADEDGFFDGELLDGRRGLVPSNFVEKLRKRTKRFILYFKIICKNYGLFAKRTIFL